MNNIDKEKFKENLKRLDNKAGKKREDILKSLPKEELAVVCASFVSGRSGFDPSSGMSKKAQIDSDLSYARKSIEEGDDLIEWLDAKSSEDIQKNGKKFLSMLEEAK